MKEIWKDISGFKDSYQVSNKGRVKSLQRYIFQRDVHGVMYKRSIPGKILSLGGTNGKGYLIVQLRNGANSHIGNCYIHRLVAECFIENSKNNPEVNHMDGNKSNNCVENLEWCTRSENEEHAYLHGLNNITAYSMGKHPRGSENYQAKINEEQAMQIYNLYCLKQFTSADIGKMFNLSRKAIDAIGTKRSWKHIHVNSLEASI